MERPTAKDILHEFCIRDSPRMEKVHQGDTYESNLMHSAYDMVNAGKGDWLYSTQYASGTTLWVTSWKFGFSSLLVKPDGTIIER